MASKKRRILVTGVARWWGALVVQRLVEDPDVAEVIGNLEELPSGLAEVGNRSETSRCWKVPLNKRRIGQLPRLFLRRADLLDDLVDVAVRQFGG